jgi:hypothetical protein
MVVIRVASSPVMSRYLSLTQYLTTRQAVQKLGAVGGHPTEHYAQKLM